MNKKLVKIFSVLLMVIMLCSIALNVFALTPSEVNGSSGNANITGISSIGNNIVKVLQTIGIVLSVVVLIILGIKYMMGSAEEKAEYKKTMIPYIVGAALIFAASAFAQVIFNFFSGWSATV